MTVDKLDIKRERFAQEYLTDSNATQSAIRAGYSAVSAHVQGTRLLKHPRVAARITQLRKELAESQQVSRENVIADLYIIAKADVLDYTINGVLDLTNLPDGASKAIERIEQVTDAQGRTVTRFVLYSKLKAAEQLAKLLGWNASDTVEHLHMKVEMDDTERARRMLGILYRPTSSENVVADQRVKPNGEG